MQNQIEQHGSKAALQDGVSLTPELTEVTTSSNNSTGLISNPAKFLQDLPKLLGVFIGQNGIVYAIDNGAGNPYAIAVGSRKLDSIIREMALEVGHGHLRKKDLFEINDGLKAYAERTGIVKQVYFRVAPIEGGIEVDLGDEKQTRIRITAGKVETITKGSETLFFRTTSSQSMVMPAEVGDIDLLNKYLNMDPVMIVLFIAWLSYTLAHPKVHTSKYVILVLQGGQGSGKSLLCRFIVAMIDPNSVVLQRMPTNDKDLAIASQNKHVLCFDNVRDFKQSMADLLCIASTGGSITSRQLYTDAEQHALNLHAALVLNGIHSFMDQPDLAQRSLSIELQPLKDAGRKSEAQMVREFEADLPAIMRGLFDLIANIFTHLPNAEITNPERMYDFVQWLAAMEKVHGIPDAGLYQSVYSDAIKHGQLDSLLDDTLAATVVDFAQSGSGSDWFGTPAELLQELNNQVTPETKRSREWPTNPIALSKRLRPLQAALLSQGISMQFTRGKERTITINFQGE